MSRNERLANGLMKIGEIAKEAGVARSTVRYYTDIGLLRVVATTDGGYRLYDRLETVPKIQQLKAMVESKPKLNDMVLGKYRVWSYEIHYRRKLRIIMDVHGYKKTFLERLFCLTAALLTVIMFVTTLSPLSA